MARKNSSESDLTIIEEKPDLSLMVTDYNEAVNASAHLVSQQAHDFNTRFAFWERQSKDGRKKMGEDGEEPMPWKNASDVRVFEADGVINEQVAVMMAAWHRGQIMVSATQMVNQWAGVKASQLLRWMFRVHLRGELAHEVERYAQWRQTYGYTAMGIFWEQQRRLEPLEFDLFSLAESMGVPEGAERLKLAETLLDPLRAEQLEAEFSANWPDVPKAIIRQAVTDFRQLRTAVIPRVSVTRSMPRWMALRAYTDIIHRCGARDLQREPRIYMRDWLTEDQLMDRAVMYDYDPKWVDAALEQKGAGGARYGEVATFAAGLSPSQRLGTSWGYGDRSETKDLIEIVHCYGIGIDERTRAPIRYCTTFQPNVPELWGKHGADPYAHGKAPFVAGAREIVDVALTEARGVPDIVRHDQDVIKGEVDGRRDASQMTTLPPLLKPMRRARERMRMGPAAQIAELVAGEHRFMDVKADPTHSVEVEEAARMRVDRYFGRIGGSADPKLQTLLNQKLVDSFLTETSEMCLQTLQLSQQYLEPTTAEMVVSGVSRVLFSGSKEDIRGQYTLITSFSVDGLDPEATMEKFQGIMELLKLDKNGAADMTGIMALGMSMIAPEVGEYFIRPVEAATESELREEDAALVSILGGVAPAPVPANANAELRANRLKTQLLANPMLAIQGQGGMLMYGPLVEQRPDVKLMLEARMKQLEHITVQRQNAIIGRQGAGTGLEKLQPPAIGDAAPAAA